MSSTPLKRLAERSSEPNFLVLTIAYHPTVVGTGKLHVPDSDATSHLYREYKKHSKATESESTVVRVDAYNDINAYLSQLSNTSIKSVEDIIRYNENNTGTEGAEPGDHPAFISGQVSPDVHCKVTLLTIVEPPARNRSNPRRGG